MNRWRTSMDKNISIDSILNKELKDPTFEEGYKAESEKLESAYAIFKAREEMGWTQNELAERANVPRSTVSRTESGNNTSIETLNKLAFAMGKKLSISIN